MAGVSSIGVAANEVSGLRVAVTGSCGTVGSELLRQLAATDVASVVGLDHNEGELFFNGLTYGDDDRFAFHLANVRDPETLRRRFDGIDLVIHTAALKHVPLCEDAPLEAVYTNIVGTQNVVEAARMAGVQRLLFTSTDKAVNPTNVMGTSKLMAERLVTAAAEASSMTVSTTRFGNVLGSSGSVLPVFRRQIAEGGPVTVTDPEMTRFVMTLGDATRLVLQSVFIGSSGDLLITKMPIANINDLAHVMVEELAPQFGRKSSDIEITTIGPRPGEKRYEELMNEEEVRRSFDIGDFLLVRPALKDLVAPEGSQGQPDRPYNSHHETPMTRDELRDFLHSNDLLNPEES